MELTYSLSVFFQLSISSELSGNWARLIKSLITTLPRKNRTFINYFQPEKFFPAFLRKIGKEEEGKLFYTSFKNLILFSDYVSYRRMHSFNKHSRRARWFRLGGNVWADERWLTRIHLIYGCSQSERTKNGFNGAVIFDERKLSSQNVKRKSLHAQLKLKSQRCSTTQLWLWLRQRKSPSS